MEIATIVMSNPTDRTVTFKTGKLWRFTIDGEEQKKVTINGIEKDIPVTVYNGDSLIGYDGCKIEIEVS